MRTAATIAIASLSLATTSCISLDTVLKAKPLQFSCAGFAYKDGASSGAVPYKRKSASFLFNDLQAFAFKPPAEPGNLLAFQDPGAPEQTAPSMKALGELKDYLEDQEKLDQDLILKRQQVGALDFSDQDKSLLILSGGGQWGAFGATFLADRRNRQIRSPDTGAMAPVQWDYVTGISTGALQALFVGADDYEGLVKAYTIEDGNELATKNGWRIIRRGSINNTAKLKQRVIQTLLYEDPEAPDTPDRAPGLLHKIAKYDIPADQRESVRRPHIFIGVVEGASGHFYEIDITRMVEDHYIPGTSPEAKDKQTDLADCVAGWALASSAVPVQLTPVIIEEESDDGARTKKAYLDGGVRSSVFVAPSIFADEARYAAEIVRRRECEQADFKSLPDCSGAKSRPGDPIKPPAPQIYVVRNGPTWVPDDGVKDKIDRNTNIVNVGLRGYATLVNQNELSSISTLLLEYPRRPLKFVSADSFDWNTDLATTECKVRERDPDKYFDPAFMRCLRYWGSIHKTRPEDKKRPSGWRDIRNPRVCPEAPAKGDGDGGQPKFCQEAPDTGLAKLFELDLRLRAKANR